MQGNKTKFDYIIGNPPYQEDIGKEAPKSNGQTRKKSVFHYFQSEVEKVAKKSVILIYPGDVVSIVQAKGWRTLD